MDEKFCYVTSRGRRTGNPHEIEIWFCLSNHTVYILMGGGESADTVRNVRADPSVSLRIGARTWQASARVVTDPAEAAIPRALIPQKYADDDTGLEEWATTALPVAIDLPEVD